MRPLLPGLGLPGAMLLTMVVPGASSDARTSAPAALTSEMVRTLPEPDLLNRVRQDAAAAFTPVQVRRYPLGLHVVYRTRPRNGGAVCLSEQLTTSLHPKERFETLPQRGLPNRLPDAASIWQIERLEAEQVYRPAPPRTHHATDPCKEVDSALPFFSAASHVEAGLAVDVLENALRGLKMAALPYKLTCGGQSAALCKRHLQDLTSDKIDTVWFGCIGRDLATLKPETQCVRIRFRPESDKNSGSVHRELRALTGPGWESPIIREVDIATVITAV